MIVLSGFNMCITGARRFCNNVHAYLKIESIMPKNYNERIKRPSFIVLRKLIFTFIAQMQQLIYRINSVTI